jgi:thiol-disulfide isomerase/thioredoxin
MTLTTIDGKKINVTGTEGGLIVEEYKGKIVFLEFFGYKCPPCLASIDHYKKLQEKHKEKLVIIAIEVQGLNNSQLQAFVKEKGINYPTIAQEKADQFVNYISMRAQWEGSIPFLVILDKKGDVQLVQAGMLPEDVLEKTIAELSK